MLARAGGHVLDLEPGLRRLHHGLLLPGEDLLKHLLRTPSPSYLGTTHHRGKWKSIIMWKTPHLNMKNWAPGMHLWGFRRAGIQIWDLWMLKMSDTGNHNESSPIPNSVETVIPKPSKPCVTYQVICERCVYFAVQRIFPWRGLMTRSHPQPSPFGSSWTFSDL